VLGSKGLAGELQAIEKEILIDWKISLRVKYFGFKKKKTWLLSIFNFKLKIKFTHFETLLKVNL
jgi:hypothetical protein